MYNFMSLTKLSNDVDFKKSILRFNSKNGITVLNTPGTVDSNYRGEIKIILINLSNENFKIERGDRIAQGVFNNVLKPKWLSMNKVDRLSDSSRNKGGFGSTGKK